MKFPIRLPAWLRILVFLSAGLPVFAAEPAVASADANQAVSADTGKIAAKNPMKLVAEGEGVHGQLAVAPQLFDAGTASDLIYTITTEPLYGRVGLAGGEDEDVYKNKSAGVGYFAYQPQDGYVGEDSFGYSVRNQNSGVIFENKVVIEVKPPAPVELDKVEITADREREVKPHPVSLQTRPNLPVTAKLPNHEDFMSEADRTSLSDTKVAYFLDDKAKPKHGLAKLDRTTGELSYSPDPDFIGDDRINYYTVDENHPELGADNYVAVSVEPIRDYKKKVADRSKSREVDLVFVINNSPSMAPHQARIAENLRRFRKLFDERQLDYRIGVLTTDFVDGSERLYKKVRSIELDRSGNPVLDRNGRPKETTKQVASNGNLVTLPVMPQPWVTPQTPDSVFAELVKVGTNGDSNRTAFTAVYNFVADYYNKQHSLLRPDATTIVVFFMDEEETRMATWKEMPDGSRKAEWVENGKLPELLQEYNARHPDKIETLDSYINYWVLRPFIIVKGNQRGKIEMDAVVSPDNVSHRRAAELTGGTVLNIESDFSEPLAELGDRIADTVAVALDPVGPGATLYKKSFRVLVDGEEVPADPKNGYIYDELTHSIRFQGAAKKKAFAAKIEITYEEHR